MPGFPLLDTSHFHSKEQMCAAIQLSADETRQRGSFLGQKHPGGVLAEHACLYPGGKQCLSQAPCLFSLGGICFACFMGQSALLHCPQQGDSPFLSALRSLPWGSLSWPRYVCVFHSSHNYGHFNISGFYRPELCESRDSSQLLDAKHFPLSLAE